MSPNKVVDFPKANDPDLESNVQLFRAQMRREGVPAKIQEKALAWFVNEAWPRFRLEPLMLTFDVPGHLSNEEAANIEKQIQSILEMQLEMHRLIHRDLIVELMRFKLRSYFESEEI